MDSTPRNPREMSDEETAQWMQELIERSADANGCAGAVGACSFEAIKNPIRRNILKALEERPLVVEEISERLGIAGSALRFHLNFLHNSRFIDMEGDVVDLTPGGVSVVRSDRRASSQNPA